METKTQTRNVEEIKEKAQEAMQDTQEGVSEAIETTASRTPSYLFIFAAGASILASLILQLQKKRQLSLFVGQWVPSFLLFGIYNKLAKSMGPD